MSGADPTPILVETPSWEEGVESEMPGAEFKMSYSLEGGPEAEKQGRRSVSII